MSDADESSEEKKGKSMFRLRNQVIFVFVVVPVTGYFLCMTPPIRWMMRDQLSKPSEDLIDGLNLALQRKDAAAAAAASQITRRKWTYRETSIWNWWQKWVDDSNDYTLSTQSDVTFEYGSFCSGVTTVSTEARVEYLILDHQRVLTLLSEKDDLPAGCQQIFRYDQLKNESWLQDCDKACDGLNVSWYHPSNIYCGAFMDGALGDFRRTCTKVKFAFMMRRISPWWPRIICAVAYFFIGYFLSRFQKVRHWMYPKDEWTAQKPNAEKASVGLEMLAPPFCCFRSANDAKRACVQLWSQCPMQLFDNAVDFFTLLSYAANGQPFYFFFCLIAMFVAAAFDPLQVRSFVAARRWYNRGFKDKTWMEVQQHEGGIEAPLAGLIAFFALMRAEPDHIDLPTFVLVLASAISSFVIAMPNASAAHAIVALEKATRADHSGRSHAPERAAQTLIGRTPSFKNRRFIDVYEEQELARRNVPQSVERCDSFRLLGVAFVSVAMCWGGMGSSLLIPYLIAVCMTASRTHKTKMYVVLASGIFLLGILFFACRRSEYFVSEVTKRRKFLSNHEGWDSAAVTAWLVALVQLLLLGLSCVAGFLGFVICPCKEKDLLKAFVSEGVQRWEDRLSGVTPLEWGSATCDKCLLPGNWKSVYPIGSCGSSESSDSSDPGESDKERDPNEPL